MRLEKSKLLRWWFLEVPINVSNFTMYHTKTLSLLDFTEDLREKELSKKIHELRKRFGLDILKTGDEL